MTVAPTMQPTAAPRASANADRRCRNCGAVALAAYCPDCGQATALHPPTVREFVHEFLGHHIAIEGSLWRTLGALLLTPGRLTADYFAGRRARYIAPLRLYLTASLLLFAVGGLSGKGLDFGNGTIAVRGSDASDRDKVVIGLREKSLALRSDAPTGIGVVDRAIARVGALTPQQRTEHIDTGIRQYLPYVLIVLVPVLALLLKLIYWNRARLYGEHLVVALHAQTVAFIVELVSSIPVGAWFAGLMSTAFLIHGGFALRTVYGGRWWPTVVRETLLLSVYGVIVGLSVAAVAMVALAL